MSPRALLGADGNVRPQYIPVGMPGGMKPLTVTIAVAGALCGLGKTKFYELIDDGRVKPTIVEWQAAGDLFLA